MRRRTFLGGLAGLLGWSWGGGSATPLTAAPSSFLRLAEPVSVSLGSLTEAWHSARFKAWLSFPGQDPPELLLRGLVVRVPLDARRGGRLKAFCRLCPHELCHVDLVHEPKAVRIEGVPKLDRPLMVCPCHNSVFDPAKDGARISGPALRGLYRFRLRTDQDRVEILEVEEEAVEFCRSFTETSGR